MDVAIIKEGAQVLGEGGGRCSHNETVLKAEPQDAERSLQIKQSICVSPDAIIFDYPSSLDRMMTPTYPDVGARLGGAKDSPTPPERPINGDGMVRQYKRPIRFSPALNMRSTQRLRIHKP